MFYTQAYENSLHFSPRFQQYAESLARQLIKRYDLHAKDIIDIGCGKGDFLRLICRLGGNRGYGFDPSYVPEQDSKTGAEPITFIQDFYSTDYAAYKADLICCRHVLEHIQFPRDFLTDVYRSIDRCLKTVTFFEVPNVMYTLRDLGIWDLIYEHCSYFSSSSLVHLFTSCGFSISNLEETYGGQFLCLEALPREKTVSSLNKTEVDPAMVSLVTAFADNYHQKVETWQGNLQHLSDTGQRVVVWGGGSKGVTFLNILETQDQIEYVVDLNPRKQGMYVAGTGQKIVSPEFLKEYCPDVIIVMNPMYANEIRQTINSMAIQVALLEV
jgi:SAM-dependent methyltransferase